MPLGSPLTSGESCSTAGGVVSLQSSTPGPNIGTEMVSLERSQSQQLFHINRFSV